ncbi:hypothetical protein F5050DRAFT_1807455 [Lentinula boryana]|uniref:UspA domain-containing protein n=1 Tax=Lentinula boryana TaxID=40481 RepID=A0ABQ8QE94_9AGAR|nr:hypothetical protein F5050DRAFT_1807455 [Lentinula boryana]
MSVSSSPPMHSPAHAAPVPRRSAMKHSFSYDSPYSSPYTESTPLPSSPPDANSPSGSSNPATSAVHRISSSTSLATQSVPSPYISMPQTPVPGYTPKVSFDTFENPAASMFSFTLRAKSAGYKRTSSTRVFLCASSPDESGREALDWALESFVQDGDDFVVFRGVEEDVLGTSDLQSDFALSLTCSLLTDKDHDLVREDARALMAYIQAKSQEYDPDRKLSIILECIAGKVTDTLDRLIALYKPDSVVVGTRGRKAWQVGIGKGTMGSVSRYCLTHSPVPIIVVRPERKVKKTVEKRRADPKRGTHFD